MMDEMQGQPGEQPEAAGDGTEALQTAVPYKLFFRMGEVSQLVGVEAYVLRYWESEFKGLAPKKSSSGQRMFRRKDVELLLQIKHLLYERKFTLEGARKWLAEQPKETVRKSTSRQVEMFVPPNPLPEIRREVAEILKMLA